MNIPFEKTFTTKQLSEALRLTRHSLLTRSSPMALYMSSKGSTSWEASIKAKPNITQDDITPAGWKILEPTKEGISTVDGGKKKGSGGLLSFFGRRATNTPSEQAIDSPSASPVTIPAVATIKTEASPRTSVDSIPVQSPAAEKSMPVSPVSSFSGPSVQPLTDSNSNIGIISENGNEVPTPPPSAVSRFLGRFSSRPKPSSSRDSIPLSADDLEFLSDVPTIHSDTEQSPGLDALSMMIKSPPLPLPTALPPPLAPPPKAPSRTFPHTPLAQDRRPSNDFSFFDPDQGTANITLAKSPLSLPTIAPIPPVKPPLGESALTSNMNSSPTHSVSLTPISGNLPSQDNEQSWSSFDYPSLSMNKPAPSQTKRSFVPIMSSSRTPPPLPKPGLAFALPPPPSSNHRSSSSSPAVGSNIASPLPPPPSSRSHTPFRAQAQPPSTIIDEDDEFSDFLSSPSQITHPAPSSFANFGPSPLAPIPSHPPPTHSNDLLNDFMNSPLPPKPPAKTAPLVPQFSGSPIRPPSNPLPEITYGVKQSKVPRKADHSRTLSLLETAAARGRWLAPPSPLPEALPPPEASSGKSSNVGPFGGNSTMQVQQAQAVATLVGHASSSTVSSNGHGNYQDWSFPPPLNTTSVVQPTSNKPPPPQPSFTSLQPPTVPLFPKTNGSASSSAKTGGLSAQDLSFFEGL